MLDSDRTDPECALLRYDRKKQRMGGVDFKLCHELERCICKGERNCGLDTYSRPLWSGWINHGAVMFE